MHSEKSVDVQKKSKSSFIEDARRTQIIEAAIDIIASQGYNQASLAKIAEYANISTSLILYHFKDKEDLMTTALATIITEWSAPAQEAMQQSVSPADKLRGYIEARLVYIGTRPKQSTAMVELLFSARSIDNKQLYRTEESGFELSDLIALLEGGQQSGDFKPFDATHMAIMIRSTIDQFLGYSQIPGIDLEAYIKDLLAWYGTLITRKGTL